MKMSEQIIVSLTTFPARIDYVYIAIQSLLRQTYDNLRVILWLSLKQFPDRRLPQNLSILCKYGLEIRFVEEDIRSHKKYFYTFQENPNSLVFLADDDIIYPSNIVEDSYRYYVNEGASKIVVSNYGFKITRHNDVLNRYTDWQLCLSDTNSEIDDLFFGSGAGTLVRANDMYNDCCNKELFLKYTPIADDIWLNAMARLGGNKILVRTKNYHLPIKVRNDIRLWHTNQLNTGGNDDQIKNVNDYYSLTMNKIVF